MNKRYSEDFKALALHMARSGKPAYKVAKSLGCNRTTVLKWMRQAGVPVKPKGAPLGAKWANKEALALIRARRAAGDTLDAIGRDLGVSKQAVSDRLRRNEGYGL